MSEKINFELELYQQNIGILGMQGCGKTHFARKILDMMPTVPRLIVSPQKPTVNFSGYGYEINKISEIENKRALIWNGDFTMETFKQICNRISNECHDMLFVVDDCHEYCTKQQIPSEWERVIQSKRNDGIFGLYLSPSPNGIHNTILQSLKHIFAFRFQSYSQVEWLAKNYFHNDAWMLLEKKLRKQEPSKYSEIEYLAKGSYIYKGWTDINTQFHFSKYQKMTEEQVNEELKEESSEQIIEKVDVNETIEENTEEITNKLAEKDEETEQL